MSFQNYARKLELNKGEDIDMQINLSSESVEVIMNSLRDSKRNLNQQIDKWDKINESSKVEICRSQLKEVSDVLSIFEEELYAR